MLRASSSYLGLAVVALVMLPVASIAGWSCGGGDTHGSTFGGGGNGNGGSPRHPASNGSGGNENTGGSFAVTTASMMTSSGPGGDPKTCAQAATFHTYIGCDFWPTVMANMVWSIFDYAVVVANTQDQPVNVTVEKGGMTVGSTTVMPNALGTIYLPWVPSLKGPDFDCRTTVCSPAAHAMGECDGAAVNTLGSSVVATEGAYHLTTNLPVTVYQFNAIEYAGDNTKGGPAGKDWSSCPGTTCGLTCNSYSNDASLLLPSTAMTGNYRFIGHEGWVFGALNILGPNVGITATEDSTQVTVKLAANGHVNAGGPIPDTPGGGTVSISLNAGDVAELVGDATGDFSGSLITATKPIQVLSGVPCIYIPGSEGACDHIEESVFPAETLGKDYIVTQPSGPAGTPVEYSAKIYGNRDNTTLTYPAGVMPMGAPTTINAGQVVDLGLITDDFEIVGSHEFAVATFLLGASAINPDDPQMKGDPSQTLPIAIEQYRTKYIFLAPTDYPVNFVDIVAPASGTVTLDGTAVPTTSFTQIGTSAYGIAHVSLMPGSNNGAHEIDGTKPVGIQVVGYGANTSYMYPGGLNLTLIAPPPPK